MALPASWALVPVTATYKRRDDGQPAKGQVLFTSPQIVVVDGQIVVPHSVMGKLDANGQLSVELPSTNDPDISPGGWTWQVHERVEGLNRQAWSIEVPHDSPGIDLSAVAPAVPVDEVTSVVTAAKFDWVSVKTWGAKGDGVTDDTVAIQAAATAAVGSTLYLPEGVYLTSGTIHITEATNVRFAGRGSVLKYTGAGSALQATTFKGIQVDGAGVIDLSAAGDTAVGLHLAGIWHCTVNDLKVLQGPANSTGILIETSEPGTDFYYGTFCITLNDIDLLDGAGLYGIRAMKTPTDPNDINSVTHLQVNNGWCKGKRTGLHLSHTSTVLISGYCVDTGYDGYYIEKSAGVTLMPGELGPVDHYAITFGTTAQEVQNISIITPPYVGVMGATQLGYLDTSLIQPTVFDRNTVALRGSAGGDVGAENYYSIMQSLYAYAKSISWRVRGGGNELEMMSWSDTGGLVIDGGAKLTVATDLEVQGTITETVPSRHVETTIALTDAATISTDCSQGNIFEVTLGGNRTIATPANALDGQKILYRLTQDATGGRTVTWSALFRFSGTYPVPTLSTAPGATDYLEFMWNVTDSRFDCLGYSLGLAAP